MVEHLAAIVVIALAVSSIVVVGRYHEQKVAPARMAAFAQQAGLNAIRVAAANGATHTEEYFGNVVFKTRVHGEKVEVTCGAKTWHFAAGIHPH